ncbi:YCF48-related protein [Flavobacterium beibuense]|uniref:Glycosyl hydrolase family 32 domain protein n=1 Tax=Flavobacterium beibuense TaxID=657326 RepID=A0A444WAV4_9FLAO|nr:YCF48-related protein [Flavobacterium beibuense]RYJ42947.1 Glycosyl hydrolase family 32 domain protein [Flavobacterium beibuense]
MFKKNIPSIFFFFLFLVANAQCGDYSRLLTTGLSKIQFFDDLHGIAYGYNTLIKTADGGDSWEFIDLPIVPMNSSELLKVEVIDEDNAVIAAYKTLFKTDDKGQSWYPIPLEIQSLELTSVSFINNQTGFILGKSNDEEIHLFTTSDGANTWSELTTDINNISESIISLIDMKFVNESIGFIWIGGTIYKTIDGGYNWQQIENPNSPSSILKKIELLENGQLLASFHNGQLSYFYMSSDLGVSWEIMPELSYDMNDEIYATSSYFDVFENKILVIGQTTGSKGLIVYDFENGVIENTFNIQAFFSEFNDVCVINENTIYIVNKYGLGSDMTLGREIYKTIDGGNNWERFDALSLMGDSTQTKLLSKSNDKYVFFNYGGSLASGPKFSIYTSDNNGVTWKEKVSQIESGNLLNVMQNYICYITFSETFEGILHESFDFGDTWAETTFAFPTFSNTPINSLSQFEQLGQNTLIRKMSGEGTISSDKGETWTYINLPDAIEDSGLANIEVKSLDEIYVWGVNDLGDMINFDFYLYKSVDLGQTWVQIVDLPNVGVGNAIFGDEEALISVGNNIYYKLDLSSNSYSQITFIHPMNETYVIPENLLILSDDIWVLLTNSIYISNDDGQTWNQKNCSVCDPQTLKAIINSEGKIILSSKKGIERLEPYVPSIPVLIGNTTVYLDSEENYYVAYDGYADAEWELVSGGNIGNTNTEAQYITVNWTEPGDHDIKVKHINDCGESDYAILTVTVLNELSIDDLSKSDVIVSPNPFSDEVNITLENLDGKSEVKIVSLAGQVVFEKVYDDSSEIIIKNLNKLSSGVYLLIIENDDSSYVKKIVKR